jgi:hypothetical protein
VWKIGPEWAAQQAKNVLASTMKARERSAVRAGISGVGVPPAAPLSGKIGAGRMNQTAGSRRTHAPTPITNCAVRQS